MSVGAERRIDIKDLFECSSARETLTIAGLLVQQQTPDFQSKVLENGTFFTIVGSALLNIDNHSERQKLAHQTCQSFTKVEHQLEAYDTLAKLIGLPVSLK